MFIITDMIQVRSITNKMITFTEAHHHWCLVTVIVEEDQINTPVSSPEHLLDTPIKSLLENLSCKWMSNSKFKSENLN